MVHRQTAYSGVIVYHADWNLMWRFSVGFQEILQFSEINFSWRSNKSCDRNPFSLESSFRFVTAREVGKVRINQGHKQASERVNERMNEQ